MKKNGFTLIEMLGVIVILSVLFWTFIKHSYGMEITFQ